MLVCHQSVCGILSRRPRNKEVSVKKAYRSLFSGGLKKGEGVPPGLSEPKPTTAPTNATPPAPADAPTPPEHKGPPNPSENPPAPEQTVEQDMQEFSRMVDENPLLTPDIKEELKQELKQLLTKTP